MSFPQCTISYTVTAKVIHKARGPRRIERAPVSVGNNGQITKRQSTMLTVTSHYVWLIGETLSGEFGPEGRVAQGPFFPAAPDDPQRVRKEPMEPGRAPSNGCPFRNRSSLDLCALKTHPKNSGVVFFVWIKFYCCFCWGFVTFIVGFIALGVYFATFSIFSGSIQKFPLALEHLLI